MYDFLDESILPMISRDVNRINEMNVRFYLEYLTLHTVVKFDCILCHLVPILFTSNYFLVGGKYLSPNLAPADLFKLK